MQKVGARGTSYGSRRRKVRGEKFGGVVLGGEKLAAKSRRRKVLAAKSSSGEKSATKSRRRKVGGEKRCSPTGARFDTWGEI